MKIFVTSNLQGWFDSKDLFPKQKTKGLYYLLTELEKAKKQNPQSLLLDSGDFFYGSVRSFYSLKKEKNIFLNYFFQLPYDILTLGNRDLEQPQELEKILKNKMVISSNLESNFTKPYEIFFVSGKKVFIASLSYLDNSFQRAGWKKLHWKKEFSKIKQIIKKETPDLVIGIFHLSLFYSRGYHLPSIEQVVLHSPIWDLIIAGQSFRALPDKSEPIERILGIPIARARGLGKSWLEINITFQEDQRFFDFKQHYPKVQKTNQHSSDFLQYLNDSTGWVYKKSSKKNKKICLQNSLHLALEENWSLLPRLELKSFFLKSGEFLRRKHLFYWVNYFNRKNIAFFAPHDFQKILQKEFQKDYFFESNVPFPITNNFFQKYQKKYPVALNNYELKEDSFVVKSLLQKPENIALPEQYIHNLWFDYFKNHSPSKKCFMFQKENKNF